MSGASFLAGDFNTSHFTSSGVREHNEIDTDNPAFLRTILEGEFSPYHPVPLDGCGASCFCLSAGSEFFSIGLSMVLISPTHQQLLDAESGAHGQDQAGVAALRLSVADDFIEHHQNRPG